MANGHDASHSQKLLDRICRDLIRRKRQGENACLDDYLNRFAWLAGDECLLDFIDADLCVSAELGIPSPADAYRKRFPKLALAIDQLEQIQDVQPPLPTEPLNQDVSSLQDSALGAPANQRRGDPFPGDSIEKSAPVKPRIAPETVSQQLGGYRILEVIGRGAMGVVYEAKQLSLDRIVALKTIRDRWAGNPVMLARFTREAYAAAQLQHHNVVQIHDFGHAHGTYYFSMERIHGGSLDRLVEQHGPLEPKVAARYILQAARGLAVAHHSGMVHRDVKPANLLLGEDAVVKVADLGLVKIPNLPDPDSHVGVASGSIPNGTGVTIQGTAVGTPAYMAPEQGDDAGSVDHRADIYSLGCTFFFLLTGKPPFESEEVPEVLAKHALEPFPDPRTVRSDIPESLSKMIRRATAKEPRNRYDSLDRMIKQLESYLGIRHAKRFQPSPDQVDELERLAAGYLRASSPKKYSEPIFWAAVIVAFAALSLTWLIGWSWVMVGPAFLVASVITVIGLAGTTNPIHLALRRWLVSTDGWTLLMAATYAIATGILVMLGGFTTGWLLGTIVGVGMGVIYHIAIVVSTGASVAEILSSSGRYIRSLRMDGTDEDTLRHFVARSVAQYAGKSWQRFYEGLFGYSAMIKMRDRLRHDKTLNEDMSSGSLRDRVCQMLDQPIRRNQRRRDHHRLAKVERGGLVSQGVSQGTAKKQAWDVAAAVIEASQLSDYRLQVPTVAPSIAKRQRIGLMLAEARSGRYRADRSGWTPIRSALGSRTRFLVGVGLLLVFVIWAESHQLFEPLKEFETYQDLARGQVDLSPIGEAAQRAARRSVQTEVLGHQASAWSVGVAGFCLACSAFVSGWRMTPFAIVATAVILLGPMLGIPAINIPTVEMLPFQGRCPAWVMSVLVGMAIYLAGVLVGETDQ